MVVAAVFAVGLAAAAPALATPEQWRVTETSGDVRLLGKGTTRHAVRGALLASGSAIITGIRARAVVTRGREYIIVSPSTKLRLPERPSGIIQIIEDYGTALFKIEKKGTPHFGVQTKYLAALVKGTTFTVSVQPAAASVQVTEGAVEVQAIEGGAASLVRSGGIATVKAEDLKEIINSGDASKVVPSISAPLAAALTLTPPIYAVQADPSAVVAAHVVRDVHEEPQSILRTTNGLLTDAPVRLAVVDVSALINDGLATSPGSSAETNPTPPLPYPTPPPTTSALPPAEAITPPVASISVEPAVPPSILPPQVTSVAEPVAAAAPPPPPPLLLDIVATPPVPAPDSEIVPIPVSEPGPLPIPAAMPSLEPVPAPIPELAPAPELGAAPQPTPAMEITPLPIAVPALDTPPSVEMRPTPTLLTEPGAEPAPTVEVTPEPVTLPDVEPAPTVDLAPMPEAAPELELLPQPTIEAAPAPDAAPLPEPESGPGGICLLGLVCISDD